MILKILLVVGVIAVIYFFFIKKKPLKNNKKADETQQSSDMVECSRCGIYAELSDSIISNNKYYCSKECLENS